ncbi:RRQRL motif-containing zinc-binding protein [Streptomyces sp. H27-D2]|uniref:RRQRL motif-containing zinc-binding protein n=1 Tax=Streptomyces sp. H27-D2 TaxID=3046304 RepID=UPI002DBBB384|nr:RRQRL motif-containing zinc-binding protein [Streptomyces sp. H27-D2]MEC4018870.1 RRQRL motif-containing zinc-binding protein [Streptomyces sp. H27-D2]
MSARMRFYDPDGTRYGIPTFPFRLAPDGLATRRQLRAEGLRPGGQDIAAQVLWSSRRYGRTVRAAYLYRTDLAKPVRPMTEAKWAALAKAMTARRTCPDCRTDAGYCIPVSLGRCVACAYPEDQRAA